jgi:cytochrome c biogenesis protein
VLLGAIVMVLGLIASLTVRRRRIWFRLIPGPAGTAVTAGGLARTDAESFTDEFRRTVVAVALATTARTDSTPTAEQTSTTPDPTAAKD